MDAEGYSEAAERLEEEFLTGGMSTAEYTRRRRELEEGAAAATTDSAAWAPMPPLDAAHAQPAAAGVDPVTGAPLASWGRRAAGWLVDLVVYAVAFALSILVALPTEDPETGEVSDVAALMIFVVWFFGPTLYAWLMLGRWGRTLGKMAVGITVVRSDDAKRIGYARALGRAVSVWILGLFALPLLLAYVWPLWDERNQTLYDKMASTIVVRPA